MGRRNWRRRLKDILTAAWRGLSMKSLKPTLVDEFRCFLWSAVVAAATDVVVVNLHMHLQLSDLLYLSLWLLLPPLLLPPLPLLLPLATAA